MGFWVFMLAMDLLIPAIMILCGHFFQKKAPGAINPVFGYRTSMSMKNQETWEFAHHTCGRLWYRWGWGMAAVTAAALLLVLGKDQDTVGTVGEVVCIAQLIPLFGTIVLVETALRARYDRNGIPKEAIRLKGKIAAWFWAVFLLGEGVMVYDLFDSVRQSGRPDWPLIVGAAVFQIVFLPIMIRNYIEIGEERLTVAFGFGKDSIEIGEIREISPNRSVIASSAASLDRIEIKGRRQTILCAVRDKEKLCEELKKRNPEITVNL